jgi:hypothetical protein
MRWGIGAVFSLITICCVGCASQPAAPIVSTIAPGQAKITIMRTDPSACIIACPAHIDANGNHLVDLAPGQSFTGGVQRGPVTLTVSQSGDIGHYNVQFDAAPGKTYAFEVSRRIEPTVAGAVGGLAGLLLEEGVSGDHSGSFKITPML